MYLVSSRKETSDSLEFIALSYHHPGSTFLQAMAEIELQWRLSDLLAEIEMLLIASAAGLASGNQTLAVSVTWRPTVSATDTERPCVTLPPFAL